MPVLEVHNLVKSFQGRDAVKGVSLSAERGEILGLLGPNGAGKTTIIHLLLGLVTPTSGQIRLLDKDLVTSRQEILSRVNFSSAYTALPSNLSVAENLRIFADLYSVSNPQRKIEELTTLLGLVDILDRVVGVLSSGQKTRLNLCKALLNDPEILFLDEPTASLDPDIAEKVREILVTLRTRNNLTIIYTTHNMREVEMICDRVIFLSRGKIILSGTPKEVIAQSQHASLEDVFITIARDGELRDSAEKRV